LTALLDVVLRFVEVVGNEDEFARPVEIPNQKDALEDPLKADVAAICSFDVRLEKLVVAALLNVDEVGNVDDRFDLSEVGAVPKVRLDR
jgi:hypothetical protein